MLDKLQKVIETADQLFLQKMICRLLLSWNHKTGDFEIHNLTIVENTHNYFQNWNTDPICFITKTDMVQLRDPAYLQLIGHSLHLYIDNISMPPCETSIKYFATVLQPPTEV